MPFRPVSIQGNCCLQIHGSTDKTMDIARSFPNVHLYESPFIGFGPLKNLAASHATFDWILSIDADEVLTPQALKSIKNLVLDPKSVYAFDRENYFIGKKIKASGWSPDRVLRLYHRSQTRYSDALVHESVITKGQKVVRVKGAISHYSYRELDDLLVKMESMSFSLKTMLARKGDRSGKRLRIRGLLFLKLTFYKGVF